jgi:Bacterial Ig domain/Calx-beta domain
MISRRARWVFATVIIVASFFAAIAVRTQAGQPPILLIVNSASSNPYGPYLAEILRAEGLNSFSVAELSTVTATTLNNASVVVLAETTLSGTQATLLNNYIAGGGRLVAMRPDAQLASALGITPAGSSTSEGYFAISAATTFADGFPTTTLPFHGQATNFSAAGESTVLATLFTNATTATSFPAVVKSGRTVTWAYDLARSVVLTRQGNPANASDRDGTPPYRTEDIFYQAIDRDKVSIPYADVQMRMLNRVIADLLADVMPLPRLWYFPGSNRTLMVVTSDSHANPQSWFDTVVASVEARGARVSFYAYNGSSPTPSAVQAWRSNGHEVGMHPAAFQYSRSLDQAFQAAQSYFAIAGLGTPSPATRIHQIEWQGWVDGAKIEASYGMGLDLSYYTWGPAVTYPGGQQAHGYINGSGLPMRFIDQAGVIVPVYQQVTSIIDEQLLVSDFSEHLSTSQAIAVSRQLIDDSQAGGYAAITTQFHVDYFAFGDVQPWAESTMDYAGSLNIPMWTAERWLNYNTARGATTITGLSWSAASRQLSFSVTVPSGSEAQSVALPGSFGEFAFTGATLDGATASSAQQIITGRTTSFINVGPGTHSVVATYGTSIPPPQHPPVAVNDTAAVSEGQSVTVAVLANDSDPDGDPLTVTSATSPGGAAVINANQTVTYTPNAGTCGSDTITYSISDGRGGTASASVSVSVTCVNGQVTHTTLGDFRASCAVPINSIVTFVGDGEVRLAGNQGDEYVQAPLNAPKWVAGTWSGGAYTPSIANGVLSIADANGAFVRSASSSPVTTLEASVRFTGLLWEHIGWGSLNFSGGYAVFSTYNTSTTLFARTTANGSGEEATNLGPIPAGFHTYRISSQAASPTSDTVSYYIDGVLRAQHTVATLPNMYVYQSHSGGTAQTLDVDRIWVFPTYTGSGTFQSCTLDIGHTLSNWTRASWSASVPPSTSLQVRTRTSTNGSTWSSWSAPLTASGQDITSPAGRYLQYLLELASSDSNQSPIVNDVTMTFSNSSVPQNQAPIAVDDSASTSSGASVTVSVLANDSDPDNDTLTVASVTQGSKGVVTINPNNTVTYTSNAGSCGPDSFTYTISDGQGGTATATVSVSVTCTSGSVTHATLADFGAVCSIQTGAIVTNVGDGEIRLAGTQGDEYALSTLDTAKWVAGTWSGGAYTPVLSGGILSISNASGAFVRSSVVLPVTTLESTARFTGAQWEHVGWGSLDFSGPYLLFSTYNTTTNLFARSNVGGGEQQTNLGAIPTGFHGYRIDRQTSSPTTDVISYYIDGVLRAQHTVATAPVMYVYQSHNGVAGPSLDIERIWVYPSHVASGSYQSCTLDTGIASASWSTADWTATVPAGTTLQLRTRTSSDASTWSAWSAPLTASGQPITSPFGQYLQYLTELTTSDPNQSPVVDSLTLRFSLEGPSMPTMSINSVTVTEGTSGAVNASFTVSLSAQASQVVTASYQTANGSATAGSDYTQTSGTVTFQPGETTKTVTVPVLADALVEPNETFTIGLSTPTNATIAQGQGTGTIVDGTAPPLPTLSINSVTVTEPASGSVNASFTVTLSAQSSQVVTASYATANGSATAGSDYTQTAGTVTFPIGSTTQTVNVPVLADALVEPNETFTISLSTPSNATIAQGQGTGTIVNSSPLPSLSINNVTITEQNSGTPNANFTVTLSPASTQTVTVAYATANGTASAGSDYSTRTGTLTYTPGQTSKSVAVPILGGTVPEPTETFFVNLSGATDATIATAQGTATINDNDGTMTVTAPTGTSNWTIGSTRTISWTNNLGATATVKLEVSRDNGSTWSQIAASIQNSSATGGSFSWVVTDPATANGRIRASWNANASVTDNSARFRISSP